MEQRRNFLRGAGIIAAFGVGAASYKQVKEMANEHKDISHLAPPDTATSIQITGAYDEESKSPVISSMAPHTFYMNGWNEQVTHRVSMTVGKDNRLWLKIGDKWHRVAVES